MGSISFDTNPMLSLMTSFALTRCLIKPSAKFQRLVNLSDYEGVEDDDGDVGDEFQDDHLAPEIVEMLVQWIFSHGSFANGSFVDVRKNECFQFKKLEKRTFSTIKLSF
jgi:hypothetical protein